MTGRWSSQFTISVVGGLVLFLVSVIPVLVIQYRRYGRLSPIRVLAASAGCVYAVALVAYTLLPLPASTACGPGGGARRQLVPFMFLRDIARETSGLGLTAVLTSRALLQVVFNVVLFVPLGLLARRFAGRSLVVAVASGLVVSLLIELTQGTALWGLYACPYRVADVDDLIANTAGSLVGALLAPRVLAWLPVPDQLTPHRFRPTRVGLVRRWLGMVLDLSIFTATAAVLSLGATVIAALFGSALGARTGWIPVALAGVLSFGVPATIGAGASWGQRIVWLTPTWPGGRSVPRQLARAAVVGGTWTASAALGAVVDPEGLGQYLSLVLAVPALVSPLVVLRTRRGLSGLVCGDVVEDSRGSEQPTPPGRGPGSPV